MGLSIRQLDANRKIEPFTYGARDQSIAVGEPDCSLPGVWGDGLCLRVASPYPREIIPAVWPVAGVAETANAVVDCDARSPR